MSNNDLLALADAVGVLEATAPAPCRKDWADIRGHRVHPPIMPAPEAAVEDFGLTSIIAGTLFVALFFIVPGVV